MSIIETSVIEGYHRNAHGFAEASIEHGFGDHLCPTSSGATAVQFGGNLRMKWPVAILTAVGDRTICPVRWRDPAATNNPQGDWVIGAYQFTDLVIILSPIRSSGHGGDHRRPRIRIGLSPNCRLGNHRNAFGDRPITPLRTGDWGYHPPRLGDEGLSPNHGFRVIGLSWEPLETGDWLSPIRNWCDRAIIELRIGDRGPSSYYLMNILSPNYGFYDRLSLIADSVIGLSPTTMGNHGFDEGLSPACSSVIGVIETTDSVIGGYPRIACDRGELSPQSPQLGLSPNYGFRIDRAIICSRIRGDRAIGIRSVIGYHRIRIEGMGLSPNWEAMDIPLSPQSRMGDRAITELPIRVGAYHPPRDWPMGPYHRGLSSNSGSMIALSPNAGPVIAPITPMHGSGYHRPWTGDRAITDHGSMIALSELRLGDRGYHRDTGSGDSPITDHGFGDSPSYSRLGDSPYHRMTVMGLSHVVLIR
ncbi:hypothetical protein H6P81_003080 [Aristolochia fimbriata]|uniref:Uncharacterized protein n=1 Tax=Aristolochia fimbriata TaxID=158543 RepID=A0AAV7FBJ7_ARIFI|nr:hypothetical protein H6P81_003080 [Aristolochia fimbriata]